MMTYVEKLNAWLKEIEESLCEFIATTRIKEFRNDPYSGVVIVTHPYFYDTNLSDAQKKMQINLKRSYSEWEEHFLLLTSKVPSHIAKEIKESTKYIKDQIYIQIPAYLVPDVLFNNFDFCKVRSIRCSSLRLLLLGSSSISKDSEHQLQV